MKIKLQEKVSKNLKEHETKKKEEKKRRTVREIKYIAFC